MKEKVANYEQHIENAIDWFWSFLPNLVIAILTLVIGFWVIRFINKMVQRFFEKRDYDLALESFLQSFIKFALRILLIVLVVTQLGVKSASLVALIGAAGLAIGLALQGSLANFAGGVLILLFKPFKIGDWISAQGVDGSVKEISIFATKLNTFGNQIAIIPNGVLANGNIINYSTEPHRRENFKIGISYGANIKTAKEILMDICHSDERILKDPPPEVYVDSLGDSAVNLTLRFWTPIEVFGAARFDLIEQSKLQFEKAGIDIPFPQRVVHQAESIN